MAAQLSSKISKLSKMPSLSYSVSVVKRLEKNFQRRRRRLIVFNRRLHHKIQLIKFYNKNYNFQIKKLIKTINYQ